MASIIQKRAMPMLGLPKYNDITVINEWKIRSVIAFQDYNWSVVTQNGTPVNTFGIAGHYASKLPSGFA